MKLKGKIDQNQTEIVKNLRKVGWTVLSLANLGNGAPDICVGAFNMNFLFEIKTDRKKKLTPDEHKFHSAWTGQVAIIYNTEDAIGKIMDSHND